MTDNPYSAPTLDLNSDSSEPQTESTPSPTFGSIAKSTFLAWERLRIAYIVILGLLTILLAGPNLPKLRTLVLIAEGGIVANVCYFAGPTIETYVRWLGYDGKMFRWCLFLGGTLLTAILAIATMMPILLPDQD